jgi:hypothetical protein
MQERARFFETDDQGRYARPMTMTTCNTRVVNVSGHQLGTRARDWRLGRLTTSCGADRDD